MTYMTALKNSLREKLGSGVRCVMAYPNQKIHSPLDKRQVIFERTKTENLALVGNSNVWSDEWTVTVLTPNESGESCGEFAEKVADLLAECDVLNVIKHRAVGKCIYDKNWLAMSCPVCLTMCGEETEGEA